MPNARILKVPVQMAAAVGYLHTHPVGLKEFHFSIDTVPNLDLGFGVESDLKTRLHSHREGPLIFVGDG